jgi:hypothetical protein
MRPMLTKAPAGSSDSDRIAHAQNQWNAMRSPEARRERAAWRTFERSLRSPQQQLAILDQRLGVGQGAKKERARLNAMISQQAPQRELVTA